MVTLLFGKLWAQIYSAYCETGIRSERAKQSHAANAIRPRLLCRAAHSSQPIYAHPLVGPRAAVVNAVEITPEK
jgi:hypothetical protein